MQRQLTALRIREGLLPFGVDLPQPDVELVHQYLQMLVIWNQRVNLTSIRDPIGILSRHFGESLFAAKKVPIELGRLADVGSGAGFPGLALKIASPALQVKLLEPNLKKAVFLNEVARTLRMANVQVFRGRFAELSSSEVFDFITSRALGKIQELLAWARTRLSPAGSVVLWLGTQDAMSMTHVLGWKWRKPIPIPGSDRRVLLVGVPSPPVG